MQRREARGAGRRRGRRAAGRRLTQRPARRAGRPRRSIASLARMTSGRAAQTIVSAPSSADLRPELGLHRRDQQRAEQADRDRVDPPAARRLGRRLRVGDHEGEEDEDLGRGDQHLPEVAVGHRAEVPVRRERVAAQREDAERAREGDPEEQLRPRAGRPARARRTRPRRSRAARSGAPGRAAPTRTGADRPGRCRGSGSRATSAKFAGLKTCLPAEVDQVLRRHRDGARRRRRSRRRGTSTSRRAASRARAG